MPGLHRQGYLRDKRIEQTIAPHFSQGRKFLKSLVIIGLSKESLIMLYKITAHELIEIDSYQLWAGIAGCLVNLIL